MCICATFFFIAPLPKNTNCEPKKEKEMHTHIMKEGLKTIYLHDPSLRFWLLRQVKVHLVADVFALWVEPLQDLGQHVDGLLAAQARALRLELLQEVFGGHWFPDQVSPDCFLRQLHVAAEQRTTDVFIYSVSVWKVRGPPTSPLSDWRCTLCWEWICRMGVVGCSFQRVLDSDCWGPFSAFWQRGSQCHESASSLWGQRCV